MILYVNRNLFIRKFEQYNIDNTNTIGSLTCDTIYSFTPSLAGYVSIVFDGVGNHNILRGHPTTYWAKTFHV